jgi:murein DD-endopeptidase MepM/ murein hydrolase activator NlpD
MVCRDEIHYVSTFRKRIRPLFILFLPTCFIFSCSPEKTAIKKVIKITPSPAIVTALPEKQPLKKIKYLDRDNSRLIPLNDRFTYLPFHPVKLIIFTNWGRAGKVFYLDKGNLYALDLNLNYTNPVKVAQSNRKEFVDLTIYGHNLFLLDKLNNIFNYDLNTKQISTFYKSLSGVQPDPQFTGIFFNKSLNVLDTAGNQVFSLLNNHQTPLFTSVNLAGLPEARDLRNGIAFYQENDLTYILKRPAIIDVYNSSYFKQRFNINQENKYGYLGLYSEPALKNLYISGGYNGSILSVSKKTGLINGEIVVLVKKKRIPVYDLIIKGKTIFILAGNYLVINKKFNEDEFDKISLTAKLQDLLFKSIDNQDIWNFILPLKQANISLPEHPSVYPGARRLYRYGIHEGIDFFPDNTKHIFIDDKTPVIAAQDGMVIRSDKNYQEMTVAEHEKVLAECRKFFQTSPQNADKLRGRQIRILHNGNLVTVYAHLSKIAGNIKENYYVKQGEIIGYVGNTGTTDGVFKTGKNMHLHFEIHIDDKSAELEYYLGKFLPIEETMQIYKRILH